MKLILRWLLLAAALLLVAYLYPGVTITSFASALIAAFVLGLLNTIVRPLLVLLTLPVTLLTLGLFLFVVNGLMLLLTSFLASRMSLGFHVDGIVPAIIGSLVVSFTAAVLNFALGTNRDDD